MFKRRKPLSFWRQAKEFFWPSMGYIRALQYIRHRIVRLSDSSHRIAIGLACGTAISFTPLVGTHFIQAGIAAWFLGGNLLASLIGTFVGNPWTFPFLWWASVELGSALFGLFGVAASNVLPEQITFAILWDIIKSEPLRVFLPWLLGGYVLAVLSLPVSYYIFYNLVSTAKAARARAKLRRMHRVAKEVTGQKQ